MTNKRRGMVEGAMMLMKSCCTHRCVSCNSLNVLASTRTVELHAMLGSIAQFLYHRRDRRTDRKRALQSKCASFSFASPYFLPDSLHDSMARSGRWTRRKAQKLTASAKAQQGTLRVSFTDYVLHDHFPVTERQEL